MTQQSIKVLVVDDDRSWHVYLFSALQQDFILRSAYEGESVLQLVDEFQPDCILLDIYLPGRNGYELCHTLKQQPATAAIPVIMLSGKNTMQEKVQGFELGAEDYLVKSTEAEFLKAKIIRAVRQSRDRESLGKNLQLAQAVAFEAMSGSAELGHCIRFIERTYAMNSFALLAEGIFKTMDEFGLRASIMLQTPSAPLFFSASGQDISALEREMFIASHREGRFCDFGERSFCNFPAISLLVKNMPLEQPERYGRIKDALPWILGAADARVQQLIELGQAREHLGELQALAQGLQQHVQRAEAWPELSEEREQVIHEWAQQLEQLRALCDKAEACLSKPYRPSAEATAAEIHSRSVDLF